MTPQPSEEAVRQLRLRYQLTASVCDEYFRAGFTVVAQDVILGDYLADMVELIKQRPLLVVVLAPRVDAVAAREEGRGKGAYDKWTVELLDRGAEGGHAEDGLWLDTSEQTAEQTVDEILRRAWDEGRVRQGCP